MTHAPSNPSETSLGGRAARVAGWCAAIGLLLFISAWPLVGAMAAANDDLKFIRSIECAGSLWEDIRVAWTNQPNFRPMENLAALLCDELTLECRWVLLIQISGLLTLVAAVARLMRSLLPGQPLALPLLLIWLCLSPATTISLWQMDTCSQTWTAAMAAWCGVLAINGVERARAGRSMGRHVVLLVLLCTIAVTIKELFYGWSAGIGLVLIVVIGGLWRRERRAALRAMSLLVPIALLPAAHLTLRLITSALAMTISSADASGDAARYQVALGANVLHNIGLSALGVFANGPLHQVTNTDASILIRLAPLASVIAVFMLLLAAAVIAIVHRPTARAGHLRALMLAAVAGLLSLSITLPMGSVSELYGFGANIASGVLVVAAILSLWKVAAPQERAMCRAIVSLCAGVLLLVGLLGVVSRAYHFRLTWEYARELNRIVLDHQQSLPADAPDSPARIYFERACYSGQMHSQYIISPVQAIGITETMDWMNRRDPHRPVVFATMDLPSSLRPIDLVVDCQSLARRVPW